jgi:hypothetical protein
MVHLDLPPEVLERYQRRWRRLVETERYPAYAEFKREGKACLCSLEDVGPEVLHQVSVYHLDKVVRLLERYKNKPSRGLAGKIVYHMVLAEFGHQLRQKFEELN